MLNVTAKFLESKFNGPGGRENLAVGVQGIDDELSEKRGGLQRCSRKVILYVLWKQNSYRKYTESKCATQHNTTKS